MAVFRLFHPALIFPDLKTSLNNLRLTKARKVGSSGIGHGKKLLLGGTGNGREAIERHEVFGIKGIDWN
jgi:hypothetical protein